MSNIRLVLSINLKKYRKEFGMSQEDLAFESTLHRTYISLIERQKRNVTIENLDKLAKALKIQTYQLLIPEENPKKEDM